MLPDRPEADVPVSLLLVDDRPAALRAPLADAGYHLVEARTAAEALRLLQEADFAVVLLGLEHDAVTLARAIRGQDRSRYTPIILFTADDNPARRVPAY